MKIKSIDNNRITFDNGRFITFYHYADCCEYNYADFEYLLEDKQIFEYDFPLNLQFEEVDGCGFRFGGDNNMIFVPCYSEQNGYYSCDVDIIYDYNIDDDEHDYDALIYDGLIDRYAKHINIYCNGIYI